MYVNICTDNKSFFNYAMELKTRGIENWGFCLHQLDDNIEALDPWDPDLTMDEQGRIEEECTDNPWYFFREILRIPVPGQDEPIMLRANEAVISSIWASLNGKNYMNFSPRQHGRSLIGKSLAYYYARFHAKRTGMLNVNSHLTNEVDQWIESIDALLPPYLRSRQSGFSQALDVDIQPSPDEIVTVKRNFLTMKADQGTVTSFHFPNAGADDAFMQKVKELNFDFLVLDDAQYHRAQYEVRDMFDDLANQDNEYGFIINIPLEAEGHTRASVHHYLQTTDNKSYWNKVFYDNQDSASSFWRLEPMTTADILKAASMYGTVKGKK